MQNENNYVIRKYLEFYKKMGYFPKFFNAYNCAEVLDVSTNITCSCSSIGGASTVTVLEVDSEFFEKHKNLFKGFSDG